MTKWSLFKKLKPENEDIKIKETKIKNEEKYKPLAEYKKTLYTSTKSPPKTSKTSSTNEEIYWTDVNSIEKKNDKLHINRAKKPKTEVYKNINKIIQKRKKK